MQTLTLPSPRPRGPLHRLWTAPTTLVGHAVARLLRCEGPFPVGAPEHGATLYLLRRARGLGAIALGHVIIADPGLLRGASAPWILAHELSHTRQHDVLGPLYLPLHGLMQAVSLLAWTVSRPPGFSPIHAWNLLERRFLCVPIDPLVTSGARLPPDHPVLQAFAVADWSPPR